MRLFLQVNNRVDKVIKKLLRSIKKRISAVRQKLTKPEKNIWCFVPYGEDFSGNLKAVFEYSLQLDVKVVILTNSKSFEKYNDQAIILNSAHCSLFFKSSIIICDQTLSVYGFFLLINKSKPILNVWHGIPLKSIFFASSGNYSPFMKKEDVHFNVISSSEVDSVSMAQCFDIPKEKVHITGLPRVDFLSCNIDTMKEEEDKINTLVGDKKLILFAPTWRFDEDDYYLFSKKELFQLETFLKENNCILGVREHFRCMDKSYYNQFLMLEPLNLGNDEFNNIEVLLKKASLLITDYSSCYFDFLFLKKPCISFAFDYAKYKQEQGFLYDLHTVFGENLCFDFHNVLQRADILLNTEYSVDTDVLNMFYKYKDFNNTERVIDVIKSITGYDQ